MMREFFAPYKLAIEIIVFSLVVGGAVWCVHLYNEHFRELGRIEVRAEYAAKLQAAEEKARSDTALLAKQVEDANARYNQREEANRVAADRAASANAGLRDALSRLRSGVPGATADSLANAVTTLSTLFGDCTIRYGDVAAKADRHANDAKRLQESWPKYEGSK